MKITPIPLINQRKQKMKKPTELTSKESAFLRNAVAASMKVPHIWKSVEDYSLYNNLVNDEKNPSKKKPKKKKN